MIILTDINGKYPLNKESVKTTKKKQTLWKRYMETREWKYYTEYCGVDIKSVNYRGGYRRMKLTTEANSNPKAVWKYMNSKAKNREGLSDQNIDSIDPKSRFTDSDREKAYVFGRFLKCFYYRSRWWHPSYSTSGVKTQHGKTGY